MRPLIPELTVRDQQLFDVTATTDFPHIEVIAASSGLSMNLLKVHRNISCRSRRLKEPHQLRMMPVSTRFTREHGLCEQALTPQGYARPLGSRYCGCKDQRRIDASPNGLTTGRAAAVKEPRDEASLGVSAVRSNESSFAKACVAILPYAREQPFSLFGKIGVSLDPEEHPLFNYNAQKD
jgi:hypothetical protein